MEGQAFEVLRQRLQNAGQIGGRERQECPGGLAGTDHDLVGDRAAVEAELEARKKQYEQSRLHAAPVGLATWRSAMATSVSRPA